MAASRTWVVAQDDIPLADVLAQTLDLEEQVCGVGKGGGSLWKSDASSPEESELPGLRGAEVTGHHQGHSMPPA